MRTALWTIAACLAWVGTAQAWGEDGEFLQMRGYDRQLERATELLANVSSTEELFGAAEAWRP